MTAEFNYQEFSTRNIGFVTEDEQQVLKNSAVFICGTGGMGGAAAMALARAGVGRFVLADLDQFEVSNLNRQVFSFADTVGKDKAQVTADTIGKINPTAHVEVLDGRWTDVAKKCVSNTNVTVNGADDLSASLLLYRTARLESRPVIDAYASSLPSVFVTRPGEATPEERLGYGTENIAWDALTSADRERAFEGEIIHVLTHSTSHNYIDMDAVGEVATGQRSRMSFAPMVITAGMLMAYESIACILDRKTGTDNVGWFFNPYKPAVERPHTPVVAAVCRFVIKRKLEAMKEAAQ